MFEYLKIAYIGFFIILSLAGIVLCLILPLILFDERQNAGWLLLYILSPAVITLLAEAIKFLGNTLERTMFV